MLHILWAVIKFILILAAILIGLVLAVILLVLFCPVRYQLFGKKDQGDWKQALGAAKISWLWGLVSFRIRYQNGREKHNLKLAGISLSGAKKKGKKKKRKKKNTSQADALLPQQEKPEAVPIQESKDIQPREIPVTVQKNQDVKPEKASNASIQNNEKFETIQRKGLFFRIREKLKRVLQGIRSFFVKLKNFKNTFNNFGKKIKWWSGFLKSEEMKQVLSLLKRQGTVLLKHLFPTSIKGKVAFGCEDPAVTGTVLAILGMSVPFHKNCIQVSPFFDSEENFLEGEVRMKGRVYGIVPLSIGIRIYFNKNIKYIFNQWKHKEDLNYGK